MSNFTFSWHSLLSSLPNLLGVCPICKSSQKQTELGPMDAPLVEIWMRGCNFLLPSGDFFFAQWRLSDNGNRQFEVIRDNFGYYHHISCTFGCVNSRPAARGTQEGVIMQPRAHLWVEHCTRLVRLKVRLGPENDGFLINCWVYGLMWKAWPSSLIWCMAAWSPTKSDWVRYQDVKSFWPSQAQLRKPKIYAKFDVVLSVLNQWH